MDIENISKDTSIKIKNVIIPIRDLKMSAKSRVKHGKSAGGLWNANDELSQIDFYKNILTNYIIISTKYDNNTIFIDFDKMINDKIYLFNKLKNILDEKNGPPPEVNLFNEKNNGETVLKLIDAGLIKSAHDVSLGGIITAISKMCIKGNKGIDLKKPKYLISDIEYFFSEDQGRYLIEVNKKDLKKVTNVLDKNAVHYDELGVINKDQLYINEKSKITIDELKSFNTSWLNNYMDN